VTQHKEIKENLTKTSLLIHLQTFDQSQLFELRKVPIGKHLGRPNRACNRTNLTTLESVYCVTGVILHFFTGLDPNRQLFSLKFMYSHNRVCSRTCTWDSINLLFNVPKCSAIQIQTIFFQESNYYKR